MYQSLTPRQTPLSPRLRKAYGMRLVKEPLLVPSSVPHRTPIRGPREVFDFMRTFVAQEPAETFWGIPLDAQHRCVAPVVITRGLLTTSLVHPRELFRAMIAANAAAVVLCHNHPGDDPTPSPEDRAVTTQLVAAGLLLDLPVFDHVIVASNRYVSFAEAGLL